MEDILIGVTDRTILVFIPDPASTTGAGKTGLAAAAITVHYTRVETDNDVVGTDVTSSLSDIALTDAHTDWGWEEVSATLAKGLYRLDIADAVFASGAWYAVVQVTITSGTAAATPKAFRLIARNDLTDISQTGDSYALANGANGFVALKADTAAILVDTGTTLDARIPAALTGDGNMKADTLRVGGTLQTAGDIPALVATVDTVVDSILVDTAEIGAAGAGLTAINLPNQTMDITGNITGNLSGSVGSVTGAVGSVTGAVGSVTGAVGSVTGAVGSVTGAVGSVAAGGITAASIATGAIDADAIAADAVTEIQAGLATPTNITAGVITTVTNLTNAPTSGDLTATMKTSIGTAVAASAVASVTANVNADVKKINGTTVNGDGGATPWGP